MAKELLAIPYYSADQVTDGAVGPDDVLNCYFEPIAEGQLALRRRPVLDSVFCTLTGSSDYGVAGIYWWERANVFVAVYGRKIFVITTGGSASDVGVTLPADALDVDFEEGETAGGVTWVYICGPNLGYPIRITFNTIFSVATVTPGGGQLFNCQSIAYINRRFVAAQPSSARFYFTDTNPATGIIENDYWDSSDNPLIAESHGDRLVLITAHTNNIYLWGVNSTEVWQDDGVTPFIPVQGALINFGVLYYKAVTVIGERVFAAGTLDGNLCIAEIRGGQAVPISNAIDNIITSPFIKLSYTTVAKTTLLLAGIPISGTSDYDLWAYDLSTGAWVKWTDYTTGSHTIFKGMYCSVAANFDVHIIGSINSGVIYRMRFGSSYQQERSLPLQLRRRTPWIQHGTWKRKRCNRVYLRLKRGHTSDGKVYLRWADDGRDTWSPSYQLNLYPTSNKDFISRNYRMGMYHSRRYEFTMSDNADFVLVGSDEDVTILRD